MSALSLSLLGRFQATLGARSLRGFRTSKVQALLVYLVAESGLASAPNVTHRREALMELLWPGLPLRSAQVNLCQTLYQLRLAIPEVGATDAAGTVPLRLSDGTCSHARARSATGRVAQVADRLFERSRKPAASEPKR